MAWNPRPGGGTMPVTALLKRWNRLLLFVSVGATCFLVQYCTLAVLGAAGVNRPLANAQTGIMPNTPTGRLGGYEPIPTDTRLNSKIVDATPTNKDINSGNPINLHPQPIPEDPHPHQIQQNNGQAPQNLTGASTDSDSSLKIKADMPMDVDMDVHGGNERPQDEKDDEKEETKDLNNMDGEESMEDEDNAKAGGLSEGKHKKGCKCGFCMNTHRFGKKDKEDKKDKKDDKDDGHHVFLKKDDDKDNEKKVDETFKRHTMLMKEYLGIKEATGMRKVSPSTKSEMDQLWKDVHADIPQSDMSAEEDPTPSSTWRWGTKLPPRAGEPVSSGDPEGALKKHDPISLDPESGIQVGAGAGAPESDYGINKMDLESEDPSAQQGHICSKCGGPCNNDTDMCDCCYQNGGEYNTGICSKCQGSGEGMHPGTKCDCCGGSGQEGGSQQPRHHLFPSHKDPDFNPRDQGINECATCGCGKPAEEGKDKVGASKPFNTHWKMDKEKAGMVKVDETKKKRICFHCKKERPCACDKKDQEDMELQDKNPDEYRKRFGVKVDKRDDLTEGGLTKADYVRMGMSQGEKDTEKPKGWGSTMSGECGICGRDHPTDKCTEPGAKAKYKKDSLKKESQGGTSVPYDYKDANNRMRKLDENSALSKKLASIPTNKLHALQESIRSKTVSKVTKSDKVISEAITKTLKMRATNETFMRHKKLMTEAVNRD